MGSIVLLQCYIRIPVMLDELDKKMFDVLIFYVEDYDTIITFCSKKN
jgi:hypothetical protein